LTIAKKSSKEPRPRQEQEVALKEVRGTGKKNMQSVRKRPSSQIAEKEERGCLQEKGFNPEGEEKN